MAPDKFGKKELDSMIEGIITPRQPVNGRDALMKYINPGAQAKPTKQKFDKRNLDNMLQRMLNGL